MKALIAITVLLLASCRTTIQCPEIPECPKEVASPTCNDFLKNYKIRAVELLGDCELKLSQCLGVTEEDARNSLESNDVLRQYYERCDDYGEDL